MFRQPIAAESPPLRVPREIQCVAQRLRRIAALDDRRKIEHREWNTGHPESFYGYDHGLERQMTHAVFTTSEGTFKVKLFDQEVPNTVANFVGLAEGTKEYTDPKTGQKTKRPI